MYIQPNSEIRIIRNVGFNNSYTDTVFFASLSDQINYFTALTKYTLTNQSYCRVNDGVLKVEKPIQDLQDCNYLMFRNISFGGKWFYAFITSVEYVNNETTKITFELDVMQTYFFDVTLKQCFVEREHTATDNIGDNIQDEPFTIEDYVYQNFKEVYSDLDNLVILVAYAHNYTVGQRPPIGDGSAYAIIDGTIQCADFFLYTIDSVGANALAQAIDEVVQRNQIDNILDIYCVPSYAFSYPIDPNMRCNSTTFLVPANAIPNQSIGYAYNSGEVTKPYSGMALVDIKGGNAGNVYYPKNNKLYTYPYFCFELSTSMGQKVQYAFEDFDGASVKLTLMTTLTNPVQLSLFPDYYKRPLPQSLETVPLNAEGALTISNFPKCAYSSDAFKAWLAQNSVPMIVDTIMGVVGGALAGAMMGGPAGGVAGLAVSGAGAITGVETGAIIGGAIGGAKSVVKHGIEEYKASRMSDSTRGTINNGNNLHAHGAYTFNQAIKHIPNQIAKIIDDQFTMYGYACNEVKYPNRHVRTKFTYTKTRGSNVQGRCPADDIAKINSIYDEGIRFWCDDATIGYYGTELSVPYNTIIPSV